jgi:hypothetical protein
MRNKTKTKKWIIIDIGGLVMILIGLTIVWNIAPSMKSSLLASASTTGNGVTASGISCDSMEHFIMHIHAHLDIFINGHPYQVPPQIGIIPNQCIYWLHTHDDTGIIHIESPEKRDFTLGEFFDVWKQKFDNSQIFDNKVGKDGSNTNALNVYVNGNRVSNSTDYRGIKLNEHDEIAIVYGAPPKMIPKSYQFPEGL